MPRRDWTREELLLAMNLYCGLSFGKFHQRNPDVIRLAGLIERTPSSVAMKLSNLASLDPAHLLRGVKGLSGASEGDRQVWAEFHADWERLAAESELARKQKERDHESGESARMEELKGMGEGKERTDKIVHPTEEGDAFAGMTVFVGETEASRWVRVRLAQRFFRRAVLSSYSVRCCISEIHLKSLLVASHILPWRDYPLERANPRNGICLSRLHDGAFDRGLVTFDEEFRLVISKSLREAFSNRVLQESFAPYAGQVMRLPERFRPDPEFLRAHRETIFKV